MTSNATCASPTTATSNTVTMTVNPNLTPSVTIAATATTICSGTSVTFTPTPTNGGTSPAYQWKVNGSNVATGSTYTTTTLANGDQITCVMTSNDPCASPTTATSNTITMTVNPNLTPAVTIAVSPNDTICAGTNVTFTPTPTNGGTAPVYQWKLNGSNIATGATYITNTLSNNDVVSVEMTSNETCLATTTATSNSITMTVNPNLTPAVTIAVSPNDTICAGTNVTFTPTPTNGGPTPTYQWKVNGTNTATGNTFSSSTLVNNDAVTVEMTSSETCLATPTGTSNTITMTVNANLTPAVTIAVSPNDTICAGTNVTFTPTPTNGGPTPTYQWKVNGSNTATGGTFSTTTLANGDAVTVELTSSEVCVTSATATSSAINMTVIPLTVPGINILASTGTTICQGSEVTFSSNTSGSGTSQTYQWTLNGTNISGANGTTYTTNTLNGGDAITCKLKITAACPSPDSAESTPLIMTIVNPALTVSVSPNDTICDNVPALFSVNPTNVGTTPLYQWYVNGSVVIGATYPTYTHPSVSHGDKITASFTGSANCVNAAPVAGDTVTMTVNATAAPAVSITANPGASVPDGQMVWFTSSVNAVGIQYQWRKNGFDIPGATGIMYTLLNPQDGDEISLWIRTSDSCRMPDTAISNTIVLQVGVGVATIKTPVFDDVSIAPNPNTGLFTLEGVINSTIDADFVNIEVVNTLGAVIHKEQVQLKDHELKTRIDLGDKAHNGLHIVRIHAGGHIHLLKFIVGRL
ncbi:MAG: hypothetical protein KDC11_03320, partial [Chitinophagaceae bacterium]|nr:hypothetical protein [Chitinophagaceae bacterium]